MCQSVLPRQILLRQIVAQRDGVVVLDVAGAYNSSRSPPRQRRAAVAKRSGRRRAHGHTGVETRPTRDGSWPNQWRRSSLGAASRAQPASSREIGESARPDSVHRPAGPDVLVTDVVHPARTNHELTHHRHLRSVLSLWLTGKVLAGPVE